MFATFTVLPSVQYIFLDSRKNNQQCKINKLSFKFPSLHYLTACSLQMVKLEKGLKYHNKQIFYILPFRWVQNEALWFIDSVNNRSSERSI